MSGNYQQGGYQPGGYPPQGGYPGGGYPGGPQTNPGQGMGIASMVCGIASLIIPFVGTATAIVGLILGVLSKKKSQEAGMPSGMATAGIVCSVIALAISILMIFLCWVPLCCAAQAIPGGLGAFDIYW